MSLQSFKRTLSAPKYFNVNTALDFINDCEPIFKLKGKLEPHFLLDLSKMKRASMLGILLIYKIIDFAMSNRCFNSPVLKYEDDSEDELERFGFRELIFDYVDNAKIEDRDYKKLKVTFSDNFIIAPQALLRSEQYSQSRLNKIYFPAIEDYYKENPKAVDMIFLVFSEVLLNFWEHAVADTKSIIVANGNKQNIEIACADTGNGIITTLGTHLAEFNYSGDRILREAIKKGVTSKSMTNHMGYGLWVLDEIVTRTKGKLHIYSQGVYYYNERGKKKTGKCGYWQGTVIYISLPLSSPVTWADIEPKENKELELQINWA